MRPKISAIIPAYNEADRIGDTVKHTLPFADEVIVVDDGSQDDTFLKAKAAGGKTIKLKKNMGKGFAVLSGFILSKGDIILFLDADIGSTAIEGKKLLQPILRGEADMTIGVLPFGKGGFGFVLGLSRLGIMMLTGRKLEAPISGQRALRREVLSNFPWERGFGLETVLTIHAIRNGFKVKEVPIKMEHRRTKKDLRGFIHRGRQFFSILIGLTKCLLRSL
ncbi:glycosyltransferase family 2 protein [bacterium]|nr:glycosyltransferase family 2 protein [bacterium]